jgi:hypothetical protein
VKKINLIVFNGKPPVPYPFNFNGSFQAISGSFAGVPDAPWRSALIFKTQSEVCIHHKGEPTVAGNKWLRHSLLFG